MLRLGWLLLCKRSRPGAAGHAAADPDVCLVCDAVQVRIVRIFNTYGPRMALDDGRVVSNFVSQALTDQPITIYGDGKQVRRAQGHVCTVAVTTCAVMNRAVDSKARSCILEWRCKHCWSQDC